MMRLAFDHIDRKLTTLFLIVSEVLKYCTQFYRGRYKVTTRVFCDADCTE